MLTRSDVSAFDFGVLGPLEVRDSHGPIALGGRKQRAVLAVLLLNANKAVSADRLIEELWGSESPRSARNTVQAYISRLRRILGARIVTLRPGYMLRLDPEELDLARFERFARLGREAISRGDAPLGATQLRRALALWRGEPFGELSLSPAAGVEVARLEERRLAVLEDRIDADLELGRHAELVDELEVLVAQHPLREQFRRQLMLALYQAGRQAEALELYRQMRETLVSELGIEPGPSLQQLQRSILAHDPALTPPEPVHEPPNTRLARKHVTVLFASFRPVDAEDPEVANRAFARDLETASSILERYQAVVEQRVGEGVTGVFGLPAAHEDDALRALRAATELRDRLAAPLRIAVESGEVLADDRVVGGDAIGRVARLKEKAEAGEIVLGERIRELVHHLARAERAGPGTWRLIEVDAGAEAIQRHFEGQLVGRDLELERIEQVFEAAVENQVCQLCTVIGSPGIGKSRLARELASRLLPRATVLEGRCPPYGDGITFWPLADIVRQAAGDTTRQAVQAFLGDEGESAIIAGQVATALGSSDAEDAGEDTFWAFRKLFEVAAHRRPLLVVFEDIHWAEPRLLDLIEHIADWSREAPIFLLCLARSEFLSERPTWGGGKPNAGSLLLAPLSQSESAALVDVRKELVVEADRHRIVERAEGNPLFIEQMLALLDEKGAEAGPGLPPTIQAVLAARLDRLDHLERIALDCASVVGPEFWLGAVSDLTGEERTDLRGALASLVRKELVRPFRSELPGEQAFRFHHLLIRDSAYESVPKETRADLHERVARWLESTFAEQATEVDEILGYHLEKAYRYRMELDPESAEWDDLALRAGDHFRRAGRKALERSDMPAAINLLESALSLWPDDHPERGYALAELGAPYRATGHWTAAHDAIENGLLVSQSQGDKALAVHLEVGRLELWLQRGEKTVDDIVRLGEQRLRSLIKLEDGPHADHARILLAWAHALLGQATQAEQMLEEVLCSPHLDARLRLRATRLLPSQWLYGPVPVAEAIRRCECLLRELTGLREVAAANRCLAGLKAMTGQFDEARALIAEDEAMLSELGLSVLSAATSSVHAMVEFLADEPLRAEEILRSGLDRLDALGKTMHSSDVAAMLARVLYVQRRYDEAHRMTELAAVGGSHDIAVPVSWRGTRAKLLARDGVDRKAVRLAQQAVELAEQTDLLDLRGDALMDLAEVLGLAGRQEEARATAKTALELYVRKGNLVSAQRARQGIRADAAIGTAV